MAHLCPVSGRKAHSASAAVADFVLHLRSHVKRGKQVFFFKVPFFLPQITTVRDQANQTVPTTSHRNQDLAELAELAIHLKRTD